MDKRAFSSAANAVSQPHDFALNYTKRPDGQIEISYQLPNDTEHHFVGLWNQFAFYVATLAHEPVQTPGQQKIIWNGCDEQGNPLGKGVYICRLSVDGRQGGSIMIKLD